jgi:hypothetical protein
MSDEDDDPAMPAAEKKPSLIPSWVTLGFILGALFVLALPRAERAMRTRGGDGDREAEGSVGGATAGSASGGRAEGATGEGKVGTGDGAPAAESAGGVGGHRPLPHLATIEAVFAQWGHYAVWKNDVTEVALWSPETKDFTDFYEAVRVGETVYFRSIPHLTRPLLTHGVPADSPLSFTETVEQRQQWLDDVRRENWRSLSEGARQSFGPATGTAAAPSGHR